MDWSNGWTAVEAIDTWVLAVGIWSIFKQVYQMTHSTSAQIAIDSLKKENLRGATKYQLNRVR